MLNQIQVLEKLNEQLPEPILHKLVASIFQGYMLNEVILQLPIFSSGLSKDLRPHIRRFCVDTSLFDFASTTDGFTAKCASNSTGNSRFVEIQVGGLLITPHFVPSIKRPPSRAKYRQTLAQRNLFFDNPNFKEFMGFYPEFKDDGLYLNLVYTGRGDEPRSIGIGVPDSNGGWFLYKELSLYPELKVLPVEEISDDLILELKRELKLVVQE